MSRRQDLRPRRRRRGAGAEADHALRQDAQAPHPQDTGLAALSLKQLPWSSDQLLIVLAVQRPPSPLAENTCPAAGLVNLAPRHVIGTPVHGGTADRRVGPHRLCLGKERNHEFLCLRTLSRLQVHRLRGVCPSTASTRTSSMLYIDPEECIDCRRACPSVRSRRSSRRCRCPAEWTQYVQLNAERVAALQEGRRPHHGETGPETGAWLPRESGDLVARRRRSIRQTRLIAQTVPDSQNLDDFVLLVDAVEDPIVAAYNFASVPARIAWIGGSHQGRGLEQGDAFQNGRADLLGRGEDASSRM